ncbi:MAG: glucosaminidase domain-containing protein [Candidatus Cyclobacteriaceae bacterium M3_2C_046]
MKNHSFKKLKYLYYTGSLSLLLLSCQKEPVQYTQSLVVEHKSLLKVDDIVEIQDSIVPPVLYNQVISLNHLPVEEKKQKFIDLILPSVLYSKYRIDQTREKVVQIKKQLAIDSIITASDSMFLAKNLQKYKAKDLEELERKLNTHPVSIVLAQAAIESGWGTSRFFLEGNNIFGIWSYRSDEQRIKARLGREGQPIYVKKYDHLYASIEDYFETIARVGAYKGFRYKRSETQNVFDLIPLLNKYSELGHVYVKKLEVVIRKNDLTRFDHYRLDPSYFIEIPQNKPNTLIASIK